MKEMLIVFICFAEIAILLAAAFVFCRRQQFSLAESLSSAIVLTFLFLSLTFQAAFLVHAPGLSFAAESLLLIASVIFIIRERRHLQQAAHQLGKFISEHPLLSAVLISIWSYLLLQSILLPEGNQDSLRYNLARVLLFQQEKSLFLANVTEFHQAVFPVGGDILRHLFLRFHVEYGLAVFNFLTYLSLVFGTYALSRRFAPPAASLLAAFICAGFPLLVHQATGTKPDILIAGVALFCVLTGARLYQKPCFRDIVFLLLGLSFGVSVKTTFLAFAAPFCLGCGVLLLQRHGRRPWLMLFARHRLAMALLVLPIIILSQVWLFGHNYQAWGGWFGPPEFVRYHRQADGLIGAVANSGRYLLQSIHLLTPVDLMAQKIFGLKISAMLQAFYDTFLDPLWGNAGTFPGIGQAPFELAGNRWGDSENGAWFGPLGFFLVLPALIQTLFAEPRFLRLIAWTGIGYWSIICWQIAWMPWNGRFFPVFFVMGACCLAFWLGKLQVKKIVSGALWITAGCVLFYAVAFNQEKELFNAGYIMRSLKEGRLDSGIVTSNIWTRTRWGQDRMYWMRWYDGDSRVADFAETVPLGAMVGIASRGLVRLFPYLVRRPDLYFVPLYSREYYLPGQRNGAQELQLDYLLYINGPGGGYPPQGKLIKQWPAPPGQAGGRTDTLFVLRK